MPIRFLIKFCIGNLSYSSLSLYCHAVEDTESKIALMWIERKMIRSVELTI